MNTITIDSNIYQSVENYAKLHNISVNDVIERGVSLLLGKVLAPKNTDVKETTGFKEALAYVRTLKAQNGKPVPENENGLEALTDLKYKL
ncbi:hypothetical protein [Prevotella sp. 885]|uniref:hypothetical protein n=1 Tax=Prevotella sp. 885 TaxID=2022527 RepID=UPI000BA129B0|nr:hypothetical protein [Prevotella sp. 885]OZT03656.1 hypothetical protein CHL74_09175 [Prevotella sp. 885]